MEEFMFFLTGGVGLENKVRTSEGFHSVVAFLGSNLNLCCFSLQLENPDPSWLSDRAWDELCRMCDLHGFKDFRFVNFVLLDSLKSGF